MSEIEAKPKHYTQWWLRWANPGETGSRKWFWQLRIMRLGLWLAPLFVLAVAQQSWSRPGVEDPSLLTRATHGVPWVLAAIVVAVFCHALWRIEVNMAADKHPFTDKDAAVFRRAGFIQAVTGLIVVIGGFIVLPSFMLATGKENADVQYIDAIYAPMALIIITGALTMTTDTVYKRGRKAYEELEKGV
jgi:hypothetical protein